MSRARLCFLLAFGACGCAGLGTDVKIPARKPPASFPSQGETGPSIARMNWRDYFADPNLNQLIGRALGSSPDLFMALQRTEVARAGVKLTSGARLPQVSAVLGAGVEKFGRYTPDGAGNATTDIVPGRTVPTSVGNFAVGLQSSWELDAWGKLANQRESAVAQYLATVEGTRLVITTLVAELAMTYFELVALDHEKDLLAETVERQRQVLEVVRLQKEAGRANELAVQQFEAQLASTAALAAETELRRRELENQLNQLAGRYPGPVPRTRDALFKEATLAGAGPPADLLANRPDIRAAEQQLRAAKCDLRAARAAFFPSISLSAGIGLEAFDPKYLLTLPASLAYSATVGLVAPLINRSAIAAQFDGAKALQIEALYNYQKVVLNAYVEVVNAMARLVGSSNIAGLKRQQQTSVAQTVEAADLLYRAGKASYFEVLIAAQNTLTADLELIAALKEARIASVRIYQALGGGWQ